MAQKLSKTGIETSQIIEAHEVSQSIDAFTAYEGTGNVAAYDISVSGSFRVTGSIIGTHLVENPLTSSWAVSSSYAISASHEIIKETSSSHADSADTASFVTGSNVYGPHGSNSVLSSSFATTASYATAIAPGLGGLWYDGTTYLSSSKEVKITGSLSVTGYHWIFDFY